MEHVLEAYFSSPNLFVFGDFGAFTLFFSTPFREDAEVSNGSIYDPSLFCRKLRRSFNFNFETFLPFTLPRFVPELVFVPRNYAQLRFSRETEKTCTVAMVSS